MGYMMASMLDKLREKTAKNYNDVTVLDCNVPSKIFTFDVSYDIDADEIVTNIEKFRQQYPKSMMEYNKVNTNVRSWHSDYATHLMTDFLNPLIDVSVQRIKQCLGNVDPKLYNIWINIYSQGDRTIRHNHGNYGFSSVYFPFVEKDPTPIIFDNNNLDDTQKIKIVPKKGMMLCFPSWMNHSVPIVTESNRISIASNYTLEQTGDLTKPIYPMDDLKDIQ